MNPIQKSYRRFLLDLHVPDWHDAFLREFDPEHFLDLIQAAGVATVTVPSNGHHGLAFWPTDVGPRHGAPGATTFLERLLAGAGARGLNRVVYHCTVYVDWYWDHHPEARIVTATGESRRVSMPGWPYPRRFAVCCPNNEDYRAFIQAQLTELCDRYEFEGVNLDMMFWPAVCYCGSCVRRHGGPIPSTVDWSDPGWTRFAAQRRAWLHEFTHELAAVVTDRRPEVAVTHQSQMYTQDWLFGGSVDLAEDTAWLSSDLYRDRSELSFDFKLFHGLSRARPFEQISSWSWPDVHEHVLKRSAPELETLAYLATMNDAAIVFLDQPDPVGTLSEPMYPVLAAINRRVAAIEPYLGGQPQRDVAIYVSFEAGYDLADGDRIPVAQVGPALEPGSLRSGPTAHRPAARWAAASLMAAHVPFGVITRRQLDRLADWPVIVLPNVVTMDDEELAAFATYVHNGGSLYLSGRTSLKAADGAWRPDFGLAAEMGVSHTGRIEDVQTFIAPTPAGAGWLGQGLLTLPSPQETVAAHSGTQVLATITRAWTDPRGERYASIIANPPGRPTDHPSVTRHGRVVYSAGILEAGRHPAHRGAFVELVRSLAAGPLTFEAEAPDCVEITLYDHPEHSYLVAHLLNAQETVPAIPVEGITLRIRLDGRTPLGVVALPALDTVKWSQTAHGVEVAVPRLDTLGLLRVDYGPYAES